MKITRKNTIILSLVAAVVILMVTAFAGAFDFRPDSDKRVARDLENLSGLPRDLVLELCDAIGDWDTVRQNIFVYKKILDTLEKDQAAYKEVFGLIAKYKAEDILAIYEFLAVNGSDFIRAGELLAEHANGTEMELVLSNALNMKDFKHYKPADEELIRSWMKDGYTPQDILNADSIAMAKDMDISKVLELKKESGTWEQVGNQLTYKFENADIKATLNIKKAACNQTISAEDYESAVKKANTEAEKKKEKIEQEVCREHNLTIMQLGEYKEDGFSVWDVQNAALLAEKSGVSMDEILQERKAGTSWEDIINSYSG